MYLPPRMKLNRSGVFSPVPSSENFSNCIFRQANVRLQAELESNSASFDQKLASTAAATAADREQMRLEIEALNAKLKEQVGIIVCSPSCARYLLELTG